MSFLMADWQKLIFVNYEVDKEQLLPHLPKGLELDSHENKYYLSFVAMRFDNTKIKGISFPFHKRFEEVNLRFYVKRKLSNGTWRKGVVFISEIVPKRAITMIARILYNESYQTLTMSHQWSQDGNSQTIGYSLDKHNQSHNIQIVSNNENNDINPNSDEHFIIERYFGYTTSRKNKTIEYKVRHRPWQTQNVLDSKMTLNFEAIYGPEFSFLNDIKPNTIYYTEGSCTYVENKKVLE